VLDAVAHAGLSRHANFPKAYYAARLPPPFLTDPAGVALNSSFSRQGENRVFCRECLPARARPSPLLPKTPVSTFLLPCWLNKLTPAVFQVLP